MCQRASEFRKKNRKDNAFSKRQVSEAVMDKWNYTFNNQTFRLINMGFVF